MVVFIWIFQVLLALHTGVGALWKFSNPVEQTMPSLSAIPNSLWQGMAVLELFCVVGLLLPLFKKSSTALSSAAAGLIAIEMLVFCGLHLASGDPSYGPVIYWLVVAAISGFISFKRYSPNPRKKSRSSKK